MVDKLAEVGVKLVQKLFLQLQIADNGKGVEQVGGLGVFRYFVQGCFQQLD